VQKSKLDLRVALIARFIFISATRPNHSIADSLDSGCSQLQTFLVNIAHNRSHGRLS
jgi:hypothetical protein